MKYKVSGRKSFSGIIKHDWEYKEKESGKWIKLFAHNAPESNFLKENNVDLPSDKESKEYDSNSKEFNLIQQSIKLKTKQRESIKMVDKGLNGEKWKPGLIGGNYFVGIDEGAGFRKSDKVSRVGTSGLIGCAALIVSGEKNDDLFVYVSHVNHKLKNNNTLRNLEFKKLKKDLGEWFAGAKNIKVFLGANVNEFPHGIDELLVLSNKESPLHILNKPKKFEHHQDVKGTVYFDFSGKEAKIEKTNFPEYQLVKNMQDTIGHGQCNPPFGHTPKDLFRPKEELVNNKSRLKN